MRQDRNAGPAIPDLTLGNHPRPDKGGTSRPEGTKGHKARDLWPVSAHNSAVTVWNLYVITAEQAAPRRPPLDAVPVSPLRHVIERDSGEEHEEIRD